jgi:hypothetical protein
MNKIGNRLKYYQISHIFIVLFLASICWITHFWDINNFGLYEDDYNFVGQPISTDLNGLIELIKNVWLRFQQGRPLGFSSSYILSFIGFTIAGIKGVYFCGYTIVLANSLIFYWLMYRLSQSIRFATIGGLTFCLFPADTTATFLTHSLGVYCCITFFLLATHAYISHHRWLAYLGIFASLISYETCFLLFLSVPLLKQEWNIDIKKELVINGLVLSLLLSITIIIRKFIGESRISELNPLMVAGISIAHTLIGPLISLSMYPYRAIYTIFNWKSELSILTLLAFILIFLILKKTSSTELNVPSRNFPQVISRSRLWIVGAIMLFSAYPLTIILRLRDIDGRPSRLHLAAIIGGSILFTLSADRLLSIAQTHTQKQLCLISLSSVFSLLVGFGLITQSDYHLAWKKQQNLVTSVIKLCPDLVDGTTLLIEEKNLHNPTQIAAYSWSMPLLLERIYQFPSQWQVFPRVYPIYGDWEKQIDSSVNLPLNKITQWLTFIPKQHPGVVKTQDVIMLKMINEKLTRLDRLSLKNGIVLNFKTRNPEAKLNFPTRPLYPYLIAPDLAK